MLYSTFTPGKKCLLRGASHGFIICMSWPVGLKNTWETMTKKFNNNDNYPIIVCNFKFSFMNEFTCYVDNLKPTIFICFYPPFSYDRIKIIAIFNLKAVFQIENCLVYGPRFLVVFELVLHNFSFFNGQRLPSTLLLRFEFPHNIRA